MGFLFWNSKFPIYDFIPGFSEKEAPALCSLCFYLFYSYSSFNRVHLNCVLCPFIWGRIISRSFNKIFKTLYNLAQVIFLISIYSFLFNIPSTKPSQDYFSYLSKQSLPLQRLIPLVKKKKFTLQADTLFLIYFKTPLKCCFLISPREMISFFLLS